MMTKPFPVALALLLLAVRPLAATEPDPLVVAMGDAPAGSECLTDTDCETNRCRAFPKGHRYCVASDKACATPGADGTVGGKSLTIGTACYRCVQGLGWQPCPPDQDTSGSAKPTIRRER
jgi:hypothetical protein